MLLLSREQLWKMNCLLPLLLAALVGSVWSSSPTARIAPRYTIDLDLPPKRRWDEVMSVFGAELEKLLQLARHTVSQEVLDVLAAIGLKVETVIPYPYNYEIMGIAEKLKGVSMGDIILANAIYEITAFSHGKKGSKACTSIVARATNGTIFHGRNLDYSLFGFLRNLTVTLDFSRNGTIVYTGTTYAGYIGLLTGQKPYGYTISLDERDRGQVWMNALEALMHGFHAIASFHIRDTLSNENMTYEEALVYLADKPLIAPCYIIIAGTKPNEGAVITRDRAAVLDFWKINSEGWYLVETNYDHWEAPPSDDDRRDPAIAAMKNMTQANLGATGLFKVLSTEPVVNDETTYTVVMSAAHPELYTTWIRTIT